MLIEPKEHGMSEEQCLETKKIVSKYGISIVCDENEVLAKEPDIVMPASEMCEDMRQTVGKYGVTVVCED